MSASNRSSISSLDSQITALEWVESMLDRACHYDGPVHAFSEREGLKMVVLPHCPESPDIENPDLERFTLNKVEMAYYRRDSPARAAWLQGQIGWCGVKRVQEEDRFVLRMNIVWNDYVFLSYVPESLHRAFIELCQSRGLFLEIPEVDIIG
jgi:hypothetical protein